MHTSRIAIVAIAWTCLTGIGRPVFAQAPPMTSCDRPEHHQFDFWIGDWDVFEASGTTPVANVRVQRLLDGCVLKEEYHDTKGLRGESLSSFDAVAASWQQTWVTNRGQVLVIHGRLENGAMVFTGVAHDPTGETRIRARWKPEQGAVRETAERSTDGGTSWQLWFDLMFRPAAGTNDDAAVAQLDARYQEAVKNNDAATMDRILADDFVLVTGTGRIYSKRDLLDAARGGRTQYEHQEDSERTVRVWGDTAVVTAKLWEKGVEGGNPFDYKLWFSDTYVRTPAGWRYVFGQASRPLQ